LVCKTEVVCNRENPTITFQFTPTVQGELDQQLCRRKKSTDRIFVLLEAEKVKTVKIDAKNLSVLELLQVTNEHISTRAPKEEPVSTIKTKSEKKGAAGAKRK
jgi:hypothetical protein